MQYPWHIGRCSMALPMNSAIWAPWLFIHNPVTDIRLKDFPKGVYTNGKMPCSRNFFSKNSQKSNSESPSDGPDSNPDHSKPKSAITTRLVHRSETFTVSYTGANRHI